MIKVLNEKEIEIVNTKPIDIFDESTGIVGWVIENGQVVAMEY